MTVLADTKQFQAGMAQAQATTQSSTGGMTSSVSKFGGLASLAMTAAAAGVVKFGIDSVKAFSEAQQVMAQTEAVLASTGGQAGVTSQDVLNLASRWQNLTGIQDDAIQSSENLLLTFRAVHNEAGRGNDIFNQATVAILDMSTALNRGAIPSAEQLQQSTIQLGKALNDPIAGMTALKRVGVSFDESQIATIKHLQESGDLMGAQKVILKELSKEFGGAAKAAGDTFAGSMAKLQANINNLQEEIGEALVPRLADLSSALSDIATKKLPETSTAISLFTQGLEDLEVVSSVLPTITGGWGASLGLLRDALDGTDVQLRLAKDSVSNWAKAVAAGSLTIEQLRKELTATGASTEAVDKIINDVRGTMAQYEAATESAAEETKKATEASRDAAQAYRDQRLAVLALSNSFLGILDSAHQVAEAQKELNRLEEHGKTATRAYEDAVLTAIEAQFGLEEAVLSYGKELVDAGEKQRDVIGKIKDTAREFGIQDEVLRGIIGRIREYINSLGNIPSHVDTTVTTHFVREGTSVQQAQHGFHGTVTRPTLFLAGEAGRERVDISPGGGGHGGVTINIGTLVGGNITEVARALRDEFLKLAARNATTGL